MAGLNKTIGHGQFITDEPTTEREVATSFIYMLTTEKHQLDLSQVYQLVATHIILNTANITHFVSTVEFGFVLAIIIKATITRESNAETIIDQMKDFFKEIKEILNGDVDPKNKSKFDFKIYFDEEYQVKISDGPKTTSELATIIKDMISMAQQANDHGTILGYQLTPVYALKSYIPNLNILEAAIDPFPEKYYKNLKETHELVIKSLAKMHDLVSDVKEFSLLLNDQDIIAAQRALDEAKSEYNFIKKALGQFIVAHRSRQQCEYTWDKLNEKFKMLIEQIENNIKNKWKPFCAKVHYYYRWKKFSKFTYVGKKAKFEKKIKNSEECYAFFCNWAEVDITPDGELAKFEQLLNDNKPCLFVDQDVTKGKFPGQSRICYYKNGTLVDEDLLQRYVDKILVSIAKSPEKSGVNQRPDDAVQLEICCPKSLKEEGCKNELHFWYCKSCYECYYYYDEFFYCKCGMASAYTFEFRCNDPAHGADFVAFERSELHQIVNEIQPMIDLNILVLGGTGVGKSTWLNALANYLSFSTLEQARLAPNSVHLIPTEYTIKGKRIRVGEENNTEKLNVGGSATAAAVGHVFITRNLRLHLIDTPGMADTNGVNKDDENMAKILSYLGGYKELHGVCILMRPSDARATFIFKYVINELLAHLHKDAAKNIIFCFTASRATFFEGSDTFTILEKHLQESMEKDARVNDIRIPLSKENVYYMDNEGVRYLYARREGIQFNETEIEANTASWNHSQKEIARMIQYVKSRKPHKMANMISLNYARHLILLLAKPLADISRSIATNLTALDAKKFEFQQLQGDEEDLQERLVIPQFDIESETLGYPRTVCTSAKCVKTQTIGNSNVVQNIYVTHCHEHCHLNGIVPNQFPDPALLGCTAMGGGQNCTKCGCSYKNHMHITYDQKIVQRFITDPTVESIVAQRSDNKAAIEQAIRRIAETIDQYKREQKVITDTSCTFGAFLRNQALMPFNDAFEDYVNHNIDEETRYDPDESLSEEIKVSRKAKVETLRQTLAEYAEQKRVIMTSQNSDVSNLQPEQIQKKIEKLFTLPKTGQNIKQIFDQANSGQDTNLSHSENKFEPSQNDIDQFHTAMQSKDVQGTVFGQHSLTPKKLPPTISVEPPKKIENGDGWGSWFADKFWWIAGNRQPIVEEDEEDRHPNDGEDDDQQDDDRKKVKTNKKNHKKKQKLQPGHSKNSATSHGKQGKNQRPSTSGQRPPPNAHNWFEIPPGSDQWYCFPPGYNPYQHPGQQGPVLEQDEESSQSSSSEED